MLWCSFSYVSVLGICGSFRHLWSTTFCPNWKFFKHFSNLFSISFPPSFLHLQGFPLYMYQVTWRYLIAYWGSGLARSLFHWQGVGAGYTPLWWLLQGTDVLHFWSFISKLQLLNISVTIIALLSSSANPKMCVSSKLVWLFSSLWIVFSCLFTRLVIWLDTSDCKFYLVGCWTFLYSYKLPICSGMHLWYTKQVWGTFRWSSV